MFIARASWVRLTRQGAGANAFSSLRKRAVLIVLSSSSKAIAPTGSRNCGSLIASEIFLTQAAYPVGFLETAHCAQRACGLCAVGVTQIPDDDRRAGATRGCEPATIRVQRRCPCVPELFAQQFHELVPSEIPYVYLVATSLILSWSLRSALSAVAVLATRPQSDCPIDAVVLTRRLERGRGEPPRLPFVMAACRGEAAVNPA